VSLRRTVTSSSDTAQQIPVSASARLDRIEAAIVSLRKEERRLSRLGLEIPLRRCREQRRYWEFLRTLLSLEPSRHRVRLARGDRE
jgi:hypothetical protein